MRDLPSGTVTFLFTDVEGSTKLLHELGAEAYDEALITHRSALREAFQRHGGVEVDTQGDAFFYAFPTAPGAVDAAREGMEALSSGPIRVRVGLHTGTPLLGRGGLHRRRRPPRSAHRGHGARRPGRALARDTPCSSSGDITDLGEHRLKDIPQAVPIFQLGEWLVPAAEDDLQHEPADAGELVRRQRRRAARGAVTIRGRRAPRHAHRARAARARRGSRSRPQPRSFPSTRPASSGSGSPRSAIRRSSRRRSPRRSVPRTGSPSTSATGSCCSCSTTSSR